MKLALKFAIRYLISKKHTNAINIISGIAVTAMVVGSATLIIVLSVFNGFESLVISLYDSFNPDLRILPKEGKVFQLSDEQAQKLKKLENVENISFVLEENALVKYGDKQFIAKLKGVDTVYHQITQVDQKLERGVYRLNENSIDYAIIGAGVELALSVNIFDELRPMHIYMPKRTAKTIINPANAFNKRSIYPTAVFSIQKEFDDKYVLVPIHFLRKLLGYHNEVSAIEVKLMAGAVSDQVKAEIVDLLGKDLTIKTRLEQNQLLFKIMQTEKFAAYCILTFILIIAAFNMIGSLSMLVIEKAKDISILKVVGGDNDFVRRIFFFQGLLMSLAGYVLGALIAFTLCFLQLKFGLLELKGLFVVDYFPVEMKLADFLLVFVTVVLISGLASWLPANKATKQAKRLQSA